MRPPELNLRRIEAFLAVIDLRNVSRAAARIDVAQSVVSRHVAALEAQLGCRLFERTGRGVTPTPAAERLAPKLRTAMEDMARASSEAALLGNRPSGIVRLGIVPTAALCLVAQLHQRVGECLPDVQLQYTEGFSTLLEDQLNDGLLDIALINRFNQRSRRGEEHLCVLDSAVIGPAGRFDPGQNVTFRQLADLPLVLSAHASVRAPFDQAARQIGLRLQVVAECDSLLIMKTLIQRARLCTVLPRQAVLDELNRGELSSARLTRPAMPRTWSLLISSRNGVSEAARAVAKELRVVVHSQRAAGAL